MNVISLFDGLSVGRIALDRLNIHVDNYYARYHMIGNSWTVDVISHIFQNMK